MKWYALKDKSGAILPGTINSSKHAVWANGGFLIVAMANPGFEEKYWKRWDPSLRAARRLGYQIVPVVVTEAQ